MSIYRFTFEYEIAGKHAADFEARCSFRASRDEGVTHIEEIEIDVGSYDRDLKRSIEDWQPADDHLAKKVEEWLWANIKDHEDRMLDAWEDDRFGSEADYRYEQMRADQMEAGL